MYGWIKKEDLELPMLKLRKEVQHNMQLVVGGGGNSCFWIFLAKNATLNCVFFIVKI